MQMAIRKAFDGLSASGSKLFSCYQDCGFSDETLIKAKLAKPMKTNRISNIYIVDS
jgi:hypothetical protein